MSIEKHSIYLGSWEHLYLVPDGIPAGLPNQLFSRHPWIIVLFEHIYCDENGYKGEERAANELHWTNSSLFCDFVKEGIIEPLAIKPAVDLWVPTTSDKFLQDKGSSIEDTIERDQISTEELFRWRIELINPFLQTNKLILYDFPLSGEGAQIPMSLRLQAEDVLSMDIASVPLSKPISSLSKERLQLFDELQEFEEQPLKNLRAGKVSHLDYLQLLSSQRDKYHEVDIELQEGLAGRRDRILQLRDRFGKRGGFQAVTDYLAAYDRGARPEDLNDLMKQLDEHLGMCFKPLLGDFKPGSARIIRALATLNPYVHVAHVAKETAEGVRDIVEPLKELFRYFRGGGPKRPV